MAAPNITFVRAGNSDAERLLAFEARLSDADRAAYLPHSSLEDAKADIQSCIFFFVLHLGSVVGTASFKNEGDWVYIGNIAVEPALRHKGLGRRAVCRMMEMNPGVAEFRLVTHPQNAVAQSLYRKLGFAIAGRTRPPFPSEIDYVMMVKRMRAA